MGKRKRSGSVEQGDERESKKNKENGPDELPQPDEPLPSDYLLGEFMKCLKTSELQDRAMREFGKQIKRLKKHQTDYDLVKAYVALSPDCEDIFTCLNKSKKTRTQVSAIFEVLTEILARTARDLKTDFRAVGYSICSRLLQIHIREIYGVLGLKNNSKIVANGLKMLTNMVMQSGACACEVGLHLELNGKVLTALAHWKPVKKKNKMENIRLLYIRFVLSFLLSENGNAIKQAIEAKGFIDSVFRHLHTEAASTVQLFLNVLLKNLIQNTAVSKTNKVKLLGTNMVLTRVAHLFHWKGLCDFTVSKKMDEKENDHAVKQLIHEKAYEFLFNACCSYKYGICFRDVEFGTSEKPVNHILARFINQLSEVTVNKHTTMIVVNILKTCPDLLKTFFKTTSLQFDPNLPEKWIRNMKFVDEVFDVQPSPPSVIAYISNSSRMSNFTTCNKLTTSVIVNSSLHCLMNSRITESALKDSLKSDDALVISSGLKYLSNCLGRVDGVVAYMKDDDNWLKSLYTNKERDDVVQTLRGAVAKLLPTVQYLVSIWNGAAEKSKYNVQQSDQLLTIFHQYQKVLPDAFACCSYDFTQLFCKVARSPNILESDDVILRAVDIVTFSLSKFRWFKGNKKNETSFYYLLKILVESSRSIEHSHVFNKVMQLAVKVAISNDLVEENLSENLLVWAEHLSRSSSSNELLKLLEESASQVAKRCYKFDDKLKLLEEQMSDRKSDQKLDRYTEEWWKLIDNMLNQAQLTTPEVIPSQKQQMSRRGACVGGERSISYLVVSMFEQLDKCEEADKFMGDLLFDLFLLRTAHKDEDKFASIVSLLYNDLPNKGNFPAIATLVAKLEYLTTSTGKPPNSPTISPPQGGEGESSSVVEAVESWFCKVLKSKKKKTAIDFPYNADDVTIRLANASQVALVVADSDVTCNDADVTMIHASKIERIILEFVFYISKLSSCTVGASHDQAIESLFRLVTKLMDRLDSSHVDSGRQVKVIALLEPLFLSTRIAGFDAGFARMVAKSADRDVLMTCFGALIGSLKSSSSNVNALRDVINELKDLFELSQLCEVFKVSMELLSTKPSEADEAILDILTGCGNLICNIDGDERLPKQTMAKLFQVILKHSADTAAGVLVKIATNLLSTKPSYSFDVNTDITTWCFDHIYHDGVATFLQILVRNSVIISKSFVSELIERDNSGDKSLKPGRKMKRILLPSIASSIQLTTATKRRKKMVKILWKFLLSENFCSDEMEDHRKILTWMIGTMKSTDEKLNDFSQTLLQGFDDISTLQHRMDFCHLILEKLENDDSVKYRCELVNCLMNLACQECKKLSNNDDSEDDDMVILEILSQQLNTLIPDNWNKSIHLSISENWNKFLKRMLKCGFTNEAVLDIVDEMIFFLYVKSGDKKLVKNLLSPGTIYEMIKSHSQFPRISLDEESQFSGTKCSLFELLHHLLPCCNDEVLKSEDFNFILAAYQATLSHTDQVIYKIMQLYSMRDVDVSKMKPFLWGRTAVESMRTRKLVSNTLNTSPGLDQLISCIDPDILLTTLTEFPIRRRMNELSSTDEEEFVSSSTRYDPIYLLSVLEPQLAEDEYVDCHLLLKSGIVTFFFACLSSHCINVRSSASKCLVYYWQHAQAARFSEKNLLLNVMEMVFQSSKVDSYSGSLHKLSSVITAFLVFYVNTLGQKNYEHMFKVLSNFLVVKPTLDVENVPEFYTTFYSSAMEYKSERSWILNLIATGMRDMGDFHLIERRQVTSILMCFYESPLSDNTSRTLILEVLERIFRVSGAVYELCNKQGVLVWLANVIKQQSNAELIHDNKVNLSKRKDCSLHISCLIQVLWQTISQKNISATEDNDGGFISRRIRSQLIGLCFDILKHCQPRLTGSSEFDEATSLVIELMGDILKYQRLSSDISHVNINAEEINFLKQLVVTKKVDQTETLDNLAQVAHFWKATKFDEVDMLVDIMMWVVELKSQVDISQSFVTTLKWMENLIQPISSQLSNNRVLLRTLVNIYHFVHNSQVKTNDMEIKSDCLLALRDVAHLVSPSSFSNKDDVKTTTQLDEAEMEQLHFIFSRICEC